MNLEQIMAEIVKDSVGKLLDFKQDTADLRMVGRSIRDGVLGGLIRGLQEHGGGEYVADIEIDINPADITSLLSNRALGDNSQKPEESEEQTASFLVSRRVESSPRWLNSSGRSRRAAATPIHPS